jgi:hypothetical protein
MTRQHSKVHFRPPIFYAIHLKILQLLSLQIHQKCGESANGEKPQNSAELRAIGHTAEGEKPPTIQFPPAAHQTAGWPDSAKSPGKRKRRATTTKLAKSPLEIASMKTVSGVGRACHHPAFAKPANCRLRFPFSIPEHNKANGRSNECIIRVDDVLNAQK